MGQAAPTPAAAYCQDGSVSPLPYHKHSTHELQNLATERSIALTHRSGLMQADKSTLVSLLTAYDAGVQAAGGKTEEGEEIDSSGQVVGLSNSTASFVEQQVLTAPGAKGMDIGGTLVKVALAIPEKTSRAQQCSFPRKFGDTGRSRPDLEFHFCLGGTGVDYQLKFISGGTAQIEEAVRRVQEQRQSSARPPPAVIQEAPSQESTARYQSANAQDASETSPAPRSPCRSPMRSLFAGKKIGESSDGGYSSTSNVLSGSPDKERQLSGSPTRRARGRQEFRKRLSTLQVKMPLLLPDSIHCSGGGAHKFASVFRECLDITLQPVKELQAVVEGLLFMHVYGKHTNSLFTIGEDEQPVSMPWPEKLYPFILVNIGSGVSVLRVDSGKENDYVRVGGTACGGSTFLGLARALTSATTFPEALRLAELGDAKKCDLLVEDIYGQEGSRELGLPGSLTACNFGKLCQTPDEESTSMENLCTEEDTARALLHMVTQQSVLLSSAYAKHAGCVDRVFFVGGFVEEENYLARVSIAENYRSLGGCAYFLEHCDYLGALGSLRTAMRNEGASPRCG